ncbi:MAG: hypothetical protein IKR43_04245 [Lachnospiraceae bacterium]|nr:hypothetical protein [Lachnospiraceae bacterium]
MDKYTYNIKAEKIQKLVKKGEFEAAVKIADTVDWEEVHSVRLLTITAAAYENIRDYKSAIELLQMAYEESAVGKRILYKLTGLAIAEGDVELAQHYYEMYLQEASDDNGRYLLRYLLAELKKEPLDKRIAILETYRKYEFEEEWALRLAQMYDEAGMSEECVKLCDEIILWFGVGDYVDEAMALKEKHAPLSAEQREHRDNKEFYKQRYQEVVNEYTDREAALVKAEYGDEEDAEGAEKPEEAWREQILLVETEKPEEAIPKTLERMAAYYRSKNLPMGKLTKISAERFNSVGFEAARARTKGKDLLVEDASGLSEDLLSDIVHSLKYEQNPQLFILADKPTQLAYLDARLGEFVENDVVVPQIVVSEVRAEDVLLHVSEAVEDELSVQKQKEDEAAQTATAAEPAGEGTPAAVPEEEAAPATEKAEEETKEAEPEQLSFQFGVGENAAEQDWALAAGSTQLTEELPRISAEEPEAEAPEVKEEEPETEVPEEKAKEPEAEVPEEKAEEPEAEVPEEKAEEPEEAPEEKAEAPEAEAPEEKPEEPEAEVSEVKAEEPEEAFPEITVEAPVIKVPEVEPAVKAAVGAAVAELTEEAKKAERIELPKADEGFLNLDDNGDGVQWTIEDYLKEKTEGEKPEEPKKEEAPIPLDSEAWEPFDGKFDAVVPDTASLNPVSSGMTKKVPVEEVAAKIAETGIGASLMKKVSDAEAAEEAKKLAEGATTVVSDVKKLAAEAEKKPLSGETKVVPKVNRTTGTIGTIGMSEEAFVEYAKNYLTSIDCVLDDVGELALQNAAESRREQGILLTKEEAENMIEDAADMAERKGGLFAKRYDKDGCLILKSKYIK